MLPRTSPKRANHHSKKCIEDVWSIQYISRCTHMQRISMCDLSQKEKGINTLCYEIRTNARSRNHARKTKNSMFFAKLRITEANHIQSQNVVTNCQFVLFFKWPCANVTDCIGLINWWKNYTNPPKHRSVLNALLKSADRVRKTRQTLANSSWSCVTILLVARSLPVVPSRGFPCEVVVLGGKNIPAMSTPRQTLHIYTTNH